MKVESLKRTEYKGVQTIYTKKVDDMLRNVRHGIHIVFIQSGMIGEFDFRTLLLTIIGAIGINRGIALVLDLVATKWISTSAVNETLKYNETADLISMSDDQCNALIHQLQQYYQDTFNLDGFDIISGKDPEIPETTETTETTDDDTSKEHIN